MRNADPTLAAAGRGFGRWRIAITALYTGFDHFDVPQDGSACCANLWQEPCGSLRAALESDYTNEDPPGFGASDLIKLAAQEQAWT